MAQAPKIKDDKNKIPKELQIKMADDELYALVKQDIDAAESYFDSNIKGQILTRYDLVHSNKDYYASKFKTLSKYTDFSTTDVNDAIEWIMPSIVEILFGAEKIVGVFGRTPDDNPEVLEKLLSFQIKSQNKGYQIITQYVRDALEAGLGVLKPDWQRETQKKSIETTITEAMFVQMPPEVVKSVTDNGDGTYSVKVEKEIVTKNQPRLQNLMPGRWIFLPDKDDNGCSVFEAERSYVLFSDLKKWERDGIVSGIDSIVPDASYEKAHCSIDEIADAILNYTGERVEKQSEETLSDKSGSGIQPAREKILVYKCYGKYDIDEDNILEDCEIWIAGETVIRKALMKYSRPPFIDTHAFDRSYSRWKQAVADLLQDIQDLKTALTRQIIINTAINNDRKVAIDEGQKTAVEDYVMGRKVVRFKLKAGENVKNFIDYLPEHQLSRETFPFIEMIQGWSEQKVGITRYNQGLDSDSLNKTATGISKIMAASQQRLRMIARNLAETGIVPLYQFLIEMNQHEVDQDMVVRLTGEYLKITPDDLKGQFDVEIKSNIGLQDSQLIVQQLMVLFTQIVPNLLQMGIATPLGVYSTAKQIIESMGFTNPAEFIGATDKDVEAMMQQQNVMQQLPQMLAQIMQAAGIQPEQAAMVVKGLESVMQPQQQGGQPGEPGTK
jgi:hypothetical protein